MKEDKMQWLLDQIKEEDAKLQPVLGECSIGKLPIRVFVLEQYLRAMKADPEFSTGAYNAIKTLVGQKMFSTTVKKGEDVEQAKRRMEVAVMLAERSRS